ncbi:hypothetical protein [Bdellovibrio sp. HCB2-146]|uniref:hypothetical protein n=1 Tax=Bdellovibrio sp. HCB2-146 TaxID=3394362 RepID=UPI0039BCC8FC
MKHLLLSITVLFAAISVQAVTKGQFAGMQMMINIASVNYDGTVDGSPQALFDAMDRPVEGSIAGQGKKLLTPKGVFNFICAHRGENNYQCSIFVQNSSYGRFAPGYAVLDIQGDEAKKLHSQFFTKDNGQFTFRNEENTLYLKVSSDRFYLVFKEGGV